MVLKRRGAVRWGVVLFLGLGCLLIGGCCLAPPDFGDPADAPTAMPTSPPPSPDTSEWTLSMEDDFSDPESGFSVREYAHGRWFYENGRYGIEVSKQNWVMQTWQGEFSDFALEVDLIAAQEAGCGGVSFGVAEEGGAYYNFCISPAGEYVLEKLVGEEGEEANWETLVSWRESEHIQTGPATNRLRVIRTGDEIWLYVNENYLAMVQDSDLSTGGVGMSAINYEDEFVLFYFDDLQIHAPPDF